MSSQPEAGKKYFTVAEANAMLPLVRAIIQDVVNLAPLLMDRRERLRRFEEAEETESKDPYTEEEKELRKEYQYDQQRLYEYLQELEKLGIELKDPRSGLIDFPCWMDDREVYLCWRLGEPEVGFWHEVHAGFAGRQKLENTASMEPTGVNP